MTLPRTTARQRATSTRDLARALLIAGAVVVAMLVLTAAFGVQQAGPAYDVVPDPAALSGLPF
jgi:hypothetical protein